MEIRTLLPDEKITEEGLYRMPLARHHAQPCEGISVTSSVLRTIELGSPAAAWDFHMLNPDAYERPERDALKLGTAMHSWVEGGEEAVKRDFIILAPGTPKKPSDRQLNAAAPSKETVEAIRVWQQIWKRQALRGCPIITQAEFDQIKIMGKALEHDPTALAVLGGEPEITIATFDDETQLWMLSRLDNLTFDGLQSDFKRISTRGRFLTERVCKARIREHRYDMQMAFGAECFWRVTGQWPTDSAIVFQMDVPPFHSHTVAIGRDEIIAGVALNHRAMRIFRECYDSGNWPGPGAVISTFQYSTAEREAFQEAVKNRSMPDPRDYVPTELIEKVE